MSKAKRHTRPRASEPAPSAAAQIDRAKLLEAVGGDGLLANCLSEIGRIIMAYRIRRIATDTSEKMLAYQARGRRMGSQCPYGWMTDPDCPAMMIPNESERKVIARIIALREVTGLSWPKIGKRLDFEGYTSRDGGRLALSSLQAFYKAAKRRAAEKKSAAAVDSDENVL